jgi:hypothetical protein
MEKYQPLRIERRPSFIKRYGSMAGFLGATAVLGFLAQFQWAGYVIIVAYVIVASIKGISARITFVLALLALGVVPIAVILTNWLVAQNFAAYSFVLLVFGVVMTTVELQREPRTSK